MIPDGVRPIQRGDVLSRGVAKTVFHVFKREATIAAVKGQLCAGLSSGIDGAIHANRLLWELHKMDEDGGFLMLHAQNAFNGCYRNDHAL